MLNGLLSNICYATDTEGCSAYYASLAVDIQKNANCGADIKSRKAVALEAFYGMSSALFVLWCSFTDAFSVAGLQNYDMLQTAACLQDTQTRAYCYVSAMSTASSPDDGYLYSLSSGIGLPSTSKPTCSTCSAKLLNLFTQTVVEENSYAGVMQPVLANATGIVKEACGSTFAGQGITMQAHVTTSGAECRFSESWIWRSLPLASAVLMAVYGGMGL